MKLKQKQIEQTKADLDASLDAYISEKELIIKQREELTPVLYDEICKTVGSPCKTDYLGKERFSFEQVTSYLKEKYSAVEVTLDEIVDYLPKDTFLFMDAKRFGYNLDLPLKAKFGYTAKPIAYVLQSPCKNLGKKSVKKEGVLVILNEIYGVLQKAYISPVSNSFVLETELIVFTNNPKEVESAYCISKKGKRY